MSFQIVKAETRVANMVTWLAGIQTKITDFVVGGKTRSKLESVAVEMEAQDFQVYRAIKKAIPVSIYQAFNFTLMPAVRSSGLLTITAYPAPAQDIIIPRGTQFATASSNTVAEKIYSTVAAATIPAGQTSTTVLVASSTPGTTGNTGPNTITVAKTTISGVTAVTNAAGFSNGADVETEDARRLRFQLYITSLARGIDGAIEYGALTVSLTDGNGNITEQVTQALVVGPPTDGPAGAFTCYIYNGADGASAALVAQAQQTIDGYHDAYGNRIPGYKAAGIVATIAAASTVPLDITASVVAALGYDKPTLQAEVKAAAGSYIQGLGLGQEYIHHELVERIMGIPGVIDVTFTTPTANQTPASNEVLIPGTIAVDVPGTIAVGVS